MCKVICKLSSKLIKSSHSGLFKDGYHISICSYIVLSVLKSGWIYRIGVDADTNSIHVL